MKDNCAFCERHGARDGQLPLIDKDLSLGDFGKGIWSVYIQQDKKTKDRWYLDARVSLNGVLTENLCGTTEIMYCPKCGRALRNT